MEFLFFIISAWAIPIFFIINTAIFIKGIAPSIIDEKDMTPAYFAGFFFTFLSLIPIANLVIFLFAFCMALGIRIFRQRKDEPQKTPWLYRLVRWANK